MPEINTTMGQIPSFVVPAITVFFVCLIGEPVVKWLMRFCGFYAIVEEGTCHVYVLFGRVMGVLHEPGLYFLWLRWGPLAFIVNWFGKRHLLDMRLDQRYLRSQPVNSEEGAPMGIGVWYEMTGWLRKYRWSNRISRRCRFPNQLTMKAKGPQRSQRKYKPGSCSTPITRPKRTYTWQVPSSTMA